MRELYLMRRYPFAFAPLLIAFTLLLNTVVPVIKLKPVPPQTFAANQDLLR